MLWEGLHEIYSLTNDMLIVIENPKNGQYLGVVGHWGSIDEAYDFRTPAFAIDFCIMHRLREVRIIVNVGDPANSIVLTVHGAEGAALQEPKNQESPQVQNAFKTGSNGAPKAPETRLSTRRDRTH